jgi:hypothetical protein
MEGNIRIYDCPRVMVKNSENNIFRAGSEGNIYLMVRTTNRWQSVYPNIALYFSNYRVYWIEDTQNIHFSRNQETLTETALLGINKTLHTDKWTFLMYF